MQLIFCLSKVAAVLGVPFFRMLQIFLILVESGVIILLFKLIQEVAPTAHVRKIVIIGLALNPIAILLVCQHCNFDVIVALSYRICIVTRVWILSFVYLGPYNGARPTPISAYAPISVHPPRDSEIGIGDRTHFA